MTNQLKKNIIITVEVGQREIVPAIYLSKEFAKKDFRVFVTTNRAAKILENKIGSCIFLHKSTIEKYAIRYQKTLGAVVCFLDIESGIPMPDERLEYWCHDRFCEVDSDKYDTVFAVGQKYKSIMHEIPEFSGIDIVASGWPRFDVLNFQDGAIFADEAKKIEQKHGKFLLVVSSFGFVTAEQFKESKKIDKESFGEDYNNPAWHYFSDFVEMIKTLSVSNKGRVILRPHPSESKSSWAKLLAGHDNIHIEASGDINNYFLACDRLIQFRSSSTLEAALLGVENLSLKIDDEEFETNSPLYRLRREFDTVADLIKYMDEPKLSAEVVRQNAISKVSEYVSNLDGSASRKIIQALVDKKVKKLPEPTLNLNVKFIHKLKMKLFDYVEKIFFATIISPPNWRHLLTYTEKLDEPIDKTMVEYYLSKFEDNETFEVKEISRDLVQIEYL